MNLLHDVQSAAFKGFLGLVGLLRVEEGVKFCSSRFWRFPVAGFVWCLGMRVESPSCQVAAFRT